MAEQKKITPFVADQMPDFVKGDHPTFVAFVEAYYEWLEDPNNSYSSVLVLQDLHDIDETLDVFAEKFYNEFLKNFPTTLAVNQITGLPVDKRKLMKNINDFYRAKGTENSYKLLFRILFDTNVEFYYPKSDILRESDGQWVENKTIKITTLNGDDVFDCEGKEIKQIGPTGQVEATALVDKLVRYTVDGYEVAELFLVNIFGLFEANKTIQCAISSTKTITETIYPILSSITIDTPGLGYKIGDDITIATSNIANGVGAKATVGRVDADGKIISVIVTDSGINYIDTSDITLTFASDTTTEFATGTPVTSGLTRYNGFFENNDGLLSTNKVIQDSHFYQEYSYQLKAESTLNSYKDTLKKLIHPAGMELFGQILIKKNLQDTHPFFSTVSKFENSLVGNYTPYTNNTSENLRLNSNSVDLYPGGYNGYGDWRILDHPGGVVNDPNNIRLWLSSTSLASSGIGGMSGGVTTNGTAILSWNNNSPSILAKAAIPGLTAVVGHEPVYWTDGSGENHGATHGLKRNTVGTILKKPVVRFSDYKTLPATDSVRIDFGGGFGGSGTNIISRNGIQKNDPDYSLIVTVLGRHSGAMTIGNVAWGGTSLSLMATGDGGPGKQLQGWVYRLQGGVTAAGADSSTGTNTLIVDASGGGAFPNWWDMFATYNFVKYGSTDEIIDSISIQPGNTVFDNTTGITSSTIHFIPPSPNTTVLSSVVGKHPSIIGATGVNNIIFEEWNESSSSLDTGTIATDGGFTANTLTDGFLSFHKEFVTSTKGVTFTAINSVTAFNGSLWINVSCNFDEKYIGNYFEPVDITNASGDATGPVSVWAVWNKPTDSLGRSYQRIYSAGNKYLSDFKIGTDEDGTPIGVGTYDIPHEPNVPDGATLAGALNNFGIDRTFTSYLSMNKSSNAVDAKNFVLGNSNERNDLVFSGDLAELLVITESLDATQKARITSYLEGRFIQPNVLESGFTAHAAQTDGGPMPHAGWGTPPVSGSSFYVIDEHPRARGVPAIPPNIAVIDIVFGASGGYTPSENFIIHEEVLQNTGGFTAKGKVINWQPIGISGAAGSTLTIQVTKNWTALASDFTASGGPISGSIATYDPFGGTIIEEHLINRRFGDVELDPFFRLEIP